MYHLFPREERASASWSVCIGPESHCCAWSRVRLFCAAKGEREYQRGTWYATRRACLRGHVYPVRAESPKLSHETPCQTYRSRAEARGEIYFDTISAGLIACLEPAPAAFVSWSVVKTETTHTRWLWLCIWTIFFFWKTQYKHKRSHIRAYTYSHEHTYSQPTPISISERLNKQIGS
jgi:hypothetical protein